MKLNHRATAVNAPLAARQSSIRAVNLALVLKTVCGADVAMTRAEIAMATGLTRATTSRLVDDLVSSGLLCEGLPNFGGRGRPGVPLRPGDEWMAVGAQVDPAFLAVRATDMQGRVLAEATVPGDFGNRASAALLRRLATLVDRTVTNLPPQIRVAGFGLALPGLVHHRDRILVEAPNLGWSNLALDQMPLAKCVADRPVYVDNEADLAALTVAFDSPGRAGELRDFVYVSGDVGVGGSIVLGGRPLRGVHGWAGEIGHMCVDPNGPACRCGSTGCLERYAGRRAIAEAGGLPPAATAQDLAAAYAAGDGRVRRAVDRAAWALGIALAGVANVIDVEAIVLGGHLGHLAPLIGDPVRTALRDRVLSAGHAEVRLVAVDSGPGAGARGACLRVFDEFISAPETR